MNDNFSYSDMNETKDKFVESDSKNSDNPNSEEQQNPKRNYNVRFSAVKILNRYERSDAYLDKLLNAEFQKEIYNKFDKALLSEIVNGVIRWRAKLDWILTGFYHGDFQTQCELVCTKFFI